MCIVGVTSIYLQIGQQVAISAAAAREQVGYGGSVPTAAVHRTNHVFSICIVMILPSHGLWWQAVADLDAAVVAAAARVVRFAAYK